jgi:hypothetical protein
MRGVLTRGAGSEPGLGNPGSEPVEQKEGQNASKKNAISKKRIISCI